MTIAYSDKYNIWSTRYSFQPTCYATVRNTLLSSIGTGLYKHDVNESRCTFYGVNEGCSLEVSSNRDPSAIKTFNSISLETNIPNWTAKVVCNEEYDDENNQEGTTEQFVTREGFQYAEVPRSSLNSTRNIFPIIPTVETVEAVGTDSYDVTFSSENYTLVPQSSESNYRAYLLSDESLVDIVEGTPLFVTLSSADSVRLTSFSGDLNGVLPEITGEQLVIASNSSVDGDKMRGPYAKILLTTNTTKQLELHAVNVDYSLSKLDASMSQNRAVKASSAQRPSSNQGLSRNR